LLRLSIKNLEKIALIASVISSKGGFLAKPF